MNRAPGASLDDATVSSPVSGVQRQGSKQSQRFIHHMTRLWMVICVIMLIFVQTTVEISVLTQIV